MDGTDVGSGVATWIALHHPGRVTALGYDRVHVIWDTDPPTRPDKDG